MSHEGTLPEGWTGDTGFSHFESRTNLERTQPQLRLYRLERMEELLRRLGSPQTRIPVIHVAGSKGKGSTSAYIASLLAASGYTVGLYTSPHVREYRERYTVVPPGYAVGENIPATSRRGTVAQRESNDADAPLPTPLPGGKQAHIHAADIVEGGPRYEEVLARESHTVWQALLEIQREGTAEDDLPTTFELLTALAFLFFSSLGCDRLVLETGLGGRLDATNVCRPDVAVITRIEREHTDYLGGTIEEIAAEKGGIIKPGVPVVVAPQRPEAEGVLRSIAAQRGSPYVAVDLPPDAQAGGPRTRTGTTPWKGEGVPLPDWLGTRVIHPAMIGAVQQRNIRQALRAYTVLTEGGTITAGPPEELIRALEQCRLPGRGEIAGDLFLDGAHTPESVTTVVEAYIRHFGPSVRTPVILGIVAGKDVEGIGEALRPIASQVIVSTPGRFKPGDPQDVANRVAHIGLPVTFVPDHNDALLAARRLRGDQQKGDVPILVTGSFYMVAELRRLVV